MPGASKPMVKVEGTAELLRAINRMEKEVSDSVRDASQGIAQRFAGGVAGRGGTRLQNQVAGAVKAKRDRIPVVTMGTGSLSSGTPIRDVMFGAEFGGQGRPATNQFPPHNGDLGYFLYPTVRELGPKVAEEWFNAIADAVEAHWHR